MMFFAFMRKKPHDLMIPSTSLCSAAASAAGVGIAREQKRRRQVDARVGALRGQNHRDQQLERVVVLERGLGVRIGRFEDRELAPATARVTLRLGNGISGWPGRPGRATLLHRVGA